MIRASLFTAAAALCLVPAAQAQYDRYGSYGGGYHAPQPTVSTVPCLRQKKDDKMAGAVVGAIAGGLLGAAIGGELEPDNGYHRYRGYRGHRGYGYGHRRHHRRGYYHSPGDDGAEIAGGLIGALAGAAIGSELASGSTDCARTYSHGTYHGSRNYGAGDVYAPTRSPTGPAWENPQRQQSSGAPYPQPASAPAYPDYREQPDDLYGAPEPEPYQNECTSVNRETRLPDGSVIREPVEVCRTDDGRWQVPSDYPNY